MLFDNAAVFIVVVAYSVVSIDFTALVINVHAAVVIIVVFVFAVLAVVSVVFAALVLADVNIAVIFSCCCCCCCCYDVK